MHAICGILFSFGWIVLRQGCGIWSVALALALALVSITLKIAIRMAVGSLAMGRGRSGRLAFIWHGGWHKHCATRGIESRA